MAGWINVVFTHKLPLLCLHSQVIKSKDSSVKCQKAAGGKPRRTWFHCYALWLYTGQVESLSSSSENNLSPSENWHALYVVIALHQEKGLQMNEDTVATWHHLWYSHFLSPENKVQTRLNRRTRWQKTDWMSAYIPLHLSITPIHAALPIPGQFFFWW